MAEVKRRKLAKKAEDNTTISKKSGKESPKTLKEGKPLDHTDRHFPPNTVVGINKGITKNMGDFESLRVDCWLSDTLSEGESIEEAFNRVNSIVDDTLEKAVLKYID